MQEISLLVERAETEGRARIFLDSSMALESSEKICPQCGSLKCLELSSLASRQTQTPLALWEWGGSTMGITCDVFLQENMSSLYK